MGAQDNGNGGGRVAVADLAARERMLGFERVEILPGSTYRDSSTVIVIPTLGLIDHRVVAAWDQMIAPMNQKRGKLYAVGQEVGRAYTDTIRNILANPELSKWKYVLTLEDDNLPPPDAHIRLLECIEAGPFDAVGGIYFTKGDINMPMAYGDPAKFASTGVLSFEPLDMRRAIAANNVVECNGIAMGCTLFRMDLFRKLEPPWFVTVSDVVEGKGTVGFTQDLFFMERAKRAGCRFAVDCRVKVGHLDPASGVVY